MVATRGRVRRIGDLFGGTAERGANLLRAALGETLGRHEPPAPAPEAPALPAREGPETFREYVDRVNPRFQWYEHCVRLATVLQRVADGELRRVIIGMPPRHGKSEELSRLFSAYYLSRFPERWAALTSYAADLAYTLSRAARDNFTRGGGALRGDASAVKHWETTAGGGMWAAGFGGPATGKGFHLGIIDDPIKNAEEARSTIIGARNREWYRSVFLTRGEPGEAIVVCMTRWPGPGDLVGWLFEEEGEDEEPERWHVVLFEAIKEPDAPKIPASCTLEPDWREAGAALCPERYPIERLKRLAKRIGAFFFGALFQQRPRPRTGSMFPRDKVEIVPAAPAVVERRVRFWDFAATEGDGDYTAGVRMSVAAGVYYIEDVARGQWGSANRDARIKQTAQHDGTDVAQRREREPGASGKDTEHAFIKLLAGWPVDAVPASSDKETRADPFASQWQAGNVKLVKGEWNRDYLDEHEAFPTGNNDDQVDGSSGAFNMLAGPSGTGVLDYYAQMAAEARQQQETTNG